MQLSSGPCRQRDGGRLGEGGNSKGVHTAVVLWQLWSQEWEALEDGARMDGGDAKVYLQFMPTLGCLLQNKVWRGKAGGRRVLQLLSGHCNVGGYLASVKKQESGSCGYCGLEEEDVHHYLLRCPRWYMQRLEMDDLIVRGDPRSSLGNMFRELERLARFVKRTGRLEGFRSMVERNVLECIVLVFV